MWISSSRESDINPVFEVQADFTVEAMALAQAKEDITASPALLNLRQHVLDQLYKSPFPSDIKSTCLKILRDSGTCCGARLTVARRGCLVQQRRISQPAKVNDPMTRHRTEAP